jgi:antitoxin component YwqK of YwqJK toxin-antitoxin module
MKQRTRPGIVATWLVLALLVTLTSGGASVAHERVDATDSRLGFLHGRIARDGMLFNGVILEHYESGAVRSERAYRDGLEHGLHAGWWENGQRAFEYEYRDGVMEGVAREWFDDGSRFRVSTYRAGHEEGPQQMWYADGTLRASYVVRDGRRFGLLGSKGCVNGSEGDET